MTYEEALESLCEDCVDWPCYALRHGDRCLQYHTLKEVIDKQIPKKPIHGQNCGSCDTFNFRHRKFCCECGQAIDWGEEE